MKKVFLVLAYCLFFPLAGLLIQLRTDGFSVDKILCPFTGDPLWNTASFSDEEQKRVEDILQQKFRYLDAGRQCFVFESEDGKYVLKFLNHERFFVSDWIKEIPLPHFLDAIRKERVERRHNRIDAFFRSFLIGFERLKAEAGLLYLQLNPSQSFFKTVTIVNPIGYEHTVDLSRVEFILQKKAEGLYSSLEQKSEDPKSWQGTLDSYVGLMVARAKKGIVDDDLNYGNIGVMEGKAILIDTGRLFLDPSLKRPERFAAELKKSSKYLKNKLSKEYPQMASYLDEEIQKRIDSYRKEFFTER
jgi:hypothetical protein